jgi:hypothetical protein
MDDKTYSATTWETDQLCWPTVHLDEKRAFRVSRVFIVGVRDGSGIVDNPETIQKRGYAKFGRIGNGSRHLVSDWSVTPSALSVLTRQAK